jgi:hypothetical protein
VVTLLKSPLAKPEGKTLARACSPLTIMSIAGKLHAGIAYEVTPSSSYWWPPGARSRGLLCFWPFVKTAVFGTEQPIVSGALHLYKLTPID